MPVRPARRAASVVAAAIMAHFRLVYRAQGRPRIIYGDSCKVEVVGEGAANIPVVQSVQWGSVRFARRFGASFRQSVALGGRGVMSGSAVAVVGRVGARLDGAHVLKSKRASGKGRRQAPSAVKNDAERMELELEERTSGVARNMAAPSEAFDSGAVDLGKKSLGGA
ncbi:hypothetical protein NDU88_003055 [Pleurodeles waltl]|uniref:Uncharacterized protein n=1 Tax=Pleurodeles waltl TaxID=8319 RepID=A0AAV7MZ35_PLEWA|nr:hypothetical protein NDU88_003055 [Pleurodeles waltl]